MTKKSLAHPPRKQAGPRHDERRKRGSVQHPAPILPSGGHGLPGRAAGTRRTGNGSLGKEVAGTVGTSEQPFLYPHPLTLACDHAEAERIRLADSEAYSSMCATWGRLGDLTTYYRYGPSWFRLLALRRWERVSPADLEAARERR